MVIPDQYTLPAIDFVAGSTQTFEFHCFSFTDHVQFDLSAFTANFSVVNYVNKNGLPLINKPMEVSAEAGSQVNSILTVTLQPSDTVDLPSGKYIYQISIRDVAGNVEIPNHGIIHLIQNINKSFAR